MLINYFFLLLLLSIISTTDIKPDNTDDKIIEAKSIALDKQASIYGECAASITLGILMFLFTLPSFPQRLNSTVLSICFTISEATAFFVVVLVILAPDSFFVGIILLALIITLAALIGLPCGLMNKNKITWRNLPSFIIFEIACAVLCLCRISAALNFRNEPYIDIVQKSGIMTSFLIVIAYTLPYGVHSFFSKLTECLGYCRCMSRLTNFAGGISNFHIEYDIHTRCTLFTMKLNYYTESIVVMAARPHHGNEEETEKAADEAVSSVLRMKAALIKRMTDVTKQSRIDRFLDRNSFRLLPDGGYYQALLSCISMGCFKAGAKFYGRTLQEHVESYDSRFQKAIPLKFDHVILKSQECNSDQFEEISVVPETTSFKASLTMASRMRQQIRDSFGNPQIQHDRIFADLRGRMHGRISQNCYKILKLRKDNGLPLTSINAVHGLYGAVVNPFPFGSTDWALLHQELKGISTAPLGHLDGYSKMVGMETAITVTNFLEIAKRVKAANRQTLTVIPCSFETVDPDTVELALGVKADRIRLPLDKDEFLLQHLSKL